MPTIPATMRRSTIGKTGGRFSRRSGEYSWGVVFSTQHPRKNWVDVLEVVTSPGQTTCELVTVAGAISVALAQEMILDGFS
ncbi:MAG: hypothetical protein WCK86_01005 [Planctomycetia bacterium]